MTQHINLLSKKARASSPAALQLLAPLGAVLLVLAGLWANGQIHENRARQQDQAARQQLQQTQARIAALQRTMGGNLDKEIEALRPKAQAAEALMSQFQTLGRQQGYSDYLDLLAAADQPGVWLDRIDIQHGGKGLSLSGHALDKAAVLGYVKRLNDRFAGLGVSFDTLDITPVAARGASTEALNVVTFKLN